MNLTKRKWGGYLCVSKGHQSILLNIFENLWLIADPYSSIYGRDFNKKPDCPTLTKFM